MTTPAGWYDDGSGRHRWWDGEQWTEHFAPETDADSEALPSGQTDAVGADGSTPGSPVTDSPGAETSGTDASDTDASGTDASDTDASGTDASVAGAPTADAPTTDASTTDASTTDAPTSATYDRSATSPTAPIDDPTQAPATEPSVPALDWSNPPPPPQDWSVPPAPPEDTSPAIPSPTEPPIPSPVPPFTPAAPGYGQAGYGQVEYGQAGYGPAGPGYADPGAYAPAGQGPGGFGTVTQAPAPLSVPGLVGLGLSVIGVILAFIPATWGLSWALLGVGFIVSLISLFFKARKWPGVTGLIVAVVGFIVAAVIGLTALVSAAIEDPSFGDPGFGDSSSAPEDIEGAVMTSTLDLAVGDCMPYLDSDEAPYEVPVVPCSQPHAEEVYYLVPFSGDAYPGEEQVTAQSDEACLAQFETFVGVAYESSSLDYYFYYPTEDSWTNDNDRVSTCVVYSSTDVTGTLQGAGY